MPDRASVRDGASEGDVDAIANAIDYGKIVAAMG
jgi:hypothetical protein